jgi:predicted NUDIX family NTP pyrophosphohydrolase
MQDGLDHGLWVMEQGKNGLKEQNLKEASRSFGEENGNVMFLPLPS